MKKFILIIILISLIIPFTFGFSEESRADLKRAAVWWGERADKLQFQLGDIGRKNPDPSNPNDKNWQEYLQITAEIQVAEEKQKLYEETARFNYYISISRDTAKTYKPIGDFMEFTVGRGVELVTAVITQSWTDLVKICVDSVLRTRIRGKIRSILDCDETVIELEKWLVVIGFGEDPWANSFDQVITNWAKGDALSKSMLITLQKEKGKQIYENFLEKPNTISFGDQTPEQWLESKSRKSADDIMDKLGLVVFIGEMAGKMWLSYEMDESIDNTLQNLKAMKDKYKEKGQDLSCEDIFLVWSKQKSIDLVDPIDPEDKKKQEELKLGLEFFLKKIPDWTKNKTVPDHFDEILRMIPIATELGEYTTVNNLRELLIKFEYKAMTPEEIADSELHSLIEESKGYLISKLKVLLNFLKTQQYDEIESQWNMTIDNWNELIKLGYNTDTDSEIQNLWIEIQNLMETLPEMLEDNNSGEDPQTTNMDTGSLAAVDSSTSDIKQTASQYKRIILSYAYSLLSALDADDYNKQKQIETEAYKYNSEMKSGILFDEIWNDSNFTSEVETVYKKISGKINELLINEKRVYSSGVTWLWKWEYNSSTSNSGF
jgi:hypothetical protein